MKLYSSIAVATLAIGLVSTSFAIEVTTVKSNRVVTPQGTVVNKNVKVYGAPHGNFRGGYRVPEQRTIILQKNRMFQGGQLTKVRQCAGGTCRTVWIKK